MSINIIICNFYFRIFYILVELEGYSWYLFVVNIYLMFYIVVLRYMLVYMSTCLVLGYLFFLEFFLDMKIVIWF